MQLKEVIARLLHSGDEIERMEAAEQLSNYESEQAVLALIEALGDQDQLVQDAAAASLEECSTDLVPYLRAALSDVRESVRQGIADLLASHPSPETEKALCLALRDESFHVRGAAARSLRAMASEQVTIVELGKLLDDPDSFPRYQALLTLQALDPQLIDETQIIQRDLYSDDPSTRAAAIDFIRKEGKLEWLDEVGKLREDPDFRVSRAANWAWERLEKKIPKG